VSLAVIGVASDFAVEAHQRAHELPAEVRALMIGAQVTLSGYRQLDDAEPEQRAVRLRP
jgi:hypothetical protein